MNSDDVEAQEPYEEYYQVLRSDSIKYLKQPPTTNSSPQFRQSWTTTTFQYEREKTQPIDSSNMMYLLHTQVKRALPCLVLDSKYRQTICPEDITATEPENQQYSKFHLSQALDFHVNKQMIQYAFRLDLLPIQNFEMLRASLLLKLNDASLKAPACIIYAVQNVHDNTEYRLLTSTVDWMSFAANVTALVLV